MSVMAKVHSRHPTALTPPLLPAPSPPTLTPPLPHPCPSPPSPSPQHETLAAQAEDHNAERKAIEHCAAFVSEAMSAFQRAQERRRGRVWAGVLSSTEVRGCVGGGGGGGACVGC